MSANNQTRYIEALSRLKSNSTKSGLIEIKVNTSSLDLIEEIMSKMEWHLNPTVNSCITHAISVSKSIDLSEIDGFALMEDFENIELDLSIKNENRLIELAESKGLDFDERFLSYVLKESVRSFYCVLFKEGFENEQK